MPLPTARSVGGEGLAARSYLSRGNKYWDRAGSQPIALLA
jgi:hypothetical protein